MAEDVALVTARLLTHQLQLQTQRFFREEMQLPRYREHDRLLKYGYRIYAQTDEDGIINEIFNRIGVRSKRFVEIGVGDGLQNNTAALLVDGWSGIWVEGHEPHFTAIRDKILPSFSKTLSLIGCAVDAENIDTVLAGVADIDFLSIDIDGNDFWIWQAMQLQARVVCIEYNALFPPPISRVQPYRRQWVWDGSNYYGASLEALARLGARKGYSLVGCNFSGTNAFFVRDDQLGSPLDYEARFLQPYTAAQHYEPIRFFATLGIGHSYRVGHFEEVKDDGTIA